jgi:hypothetical protein
MSNILDDNTVIPSYMGVSNRGEQNISAGNLTSVALRYGEIREIIYPDDKKSVSKRFIEYTVEVQQKDNNEPGTSVKYANCLQMSTFGTSADLFRYTLRPDEDVQREKGIGVGGKVLVMCINGSTTKAVIVGALRDTGTDDDGSKYQQGKDKKDDGHNLFFEFNGAQASINKDGELKVMYRGATKVTGELDDNANADAEGSTVIFNKDGGIKLYTKDEKQFIFIDHANKKIDVLADDEWHVKVNKKLLFEMGDTCTINGKSSCTIEMSDKVFIKSAGVHVGGASEAWMMGSTFRQGQQTMHQTMSGLLTTLASLVSTAATSLNAASAAHKVPIAGPIVGSVPLQAAAVALTSAGPLFSQLGSAITTFEGQSMSYLSTKNKND